MPYCQSSLLPHHSLSLSQQDFRSSFIRSVKLVRLCSGGRRQGWKGLIQCLQKQNRESLVLSGVRGNLPSSQTLYCPLTLSTFLFLPPSSPPFQEEQLSLLGARNHPHAGLRDTAALTTHIEAQTNAGLTLLYPNCHLSSPASGIPSSLLCLDTTLVLTESVLRDWNQHENKAIF